MGLPLCEAKGHHTSTILNRNFIQEKNDRFSNCWFGNLGFCCNKIWTHKPQTDHKVQVKGIMVVCCTYLWFARCFILLEKTEQFFLKTMPTNMYFPFFCWKHQTCSNNTNLYLIPGPKHACIMLICTFHCRILLCIITWYQFQTSGGGCKKYSLGVLSEKKHVHI